VDDLKLAFWRHNQESRKIEQLVELTTGFRGLPILDRGKFDTDDNIRKAINDSIPADYSGIVLGNIEEKRTYGLCTPPSSRKDILYWANLWRVFHQERPNCQLLNYAQPGLPYWTDKNGYGPKIDYVINNTVDGVPHWMLWQIIDGASISVYDPYDTREKGKAFTGPQIRRRNEAYIELLDKLFPGRPKVVNFWHRISNGDGKFTLIDFDQLWSEQLEQFVNLDGYILCAWGGGMDNYFRQSPEQELFRKNTAEEHKKAGVNINDAEQCKKYYEKQFVERCIKIDKKVKSV